MAGEEELTDEQNAEEQPDTSAFYDTMFRQKRKHGKLRVVNSPKLGSAIADTHAHIHMLPNPGLALARAGCHTVEFICAITDIHEDGSVVFDNLEAWQRDAAIGVRTISTKC